MSRHVTNSIKMAIFTLDDDINMILWQMQNGNLSLYSRDVCGEIKATTICFIELFISCKITFKHRMNGAIKKWNNDHIFKMF